jgi:hypothetical protein
MARSFFLFKILNLIGHNFKATFFPLIGRQTGLHAKMGKKLLGPWQLLPDLG